MATFNKFNSFVEKLAEKVYNLGSDTLTIALTNTLPVAANSVLTDITQISYTGLSTRVVTITSSTQTSGLYKLILQDLVLTATGTIPTWRYLVLYDDTATNDDLIGWYDYGSAVNMVNGDTFTIDFDATNGALTLQ
jgi:hypothetical protein